MGFFVRKRIKVAPGIHVNIGTKQSSVTVGRGVGVNVPLRGRSRRTPIGRSSSQWQWSIIRFLFRVALFFAAVVTILAVIGIYAMGADKLPAGAATYESFPTSIRPQLVAAYSDEVKRQELAVETAKKSLARAKGTADRAIAIDARDQATKTLSDLKSKNEPPFIGCWLDDCHKAGASRTPPIKWKANWIGITGETVTVVQVVSPNQAIVSRNIDQLLMLKGVSTDGWTDNESKPLKGAWWASGTTTYETVLGGTKTVLVLEPFDADRYLQTLKP